MLKKTATVLLLAFCLAASQPASAHAGFFLFNIINDIFNGGHKSSAPPAPAASAKSSAGSVVKFGMRNSQVSEVQQPD